MKNNFKEIKNPEIFYGLRDFVRNLFKSKTVNNTRKISIDHKTDELAARGWGENNFKQWTKSLSEKEKKSIKDYTDADSMRINSYLRKYKGFLEEKKDNILNNDWKEYQKHNESIKNLDNALEKSRTEHTMYVYRRVDGDQFFHQIWPDFKKYLRLEEGLINRVAFDMLVKNFIQNQYEETDHGFVSTSLSQDPSGTEGWEKPILLRIKLPRNSRAAYLSSEVTDFTSENEVLLARNSKFKYQKALIIKPNGKESILVEMELIND